MSITKVQYVKTASASGATTLTATVAATGAGNFLAAIVAVGSTSVNGTCTTPAGWTLAVGPATTESGAVSDVNYYLFVKVDTAGGTTSFTATDSVSSGITIQFWEFFSSTGWPANPLDVVASLSNQASTTAPSTGTTAATAQAEELWLAGLVTHYATGEVFTSPTNGFTAETVATAGSGAFFAPSSGAFYKIAAATGTASMSATASPAKPFAGIIATFKNNPAGGTPRAIAGTGTATATATVGLTDTKKVALSATAASASTAAINVTKKLAGVFAASSTASTVATVSKLLAAQGIAQATASVTITGTSGLNGSAQAQTTASVSLSVSKPIRGTALATSVVTVTLTVVDLNYREPTGTITLLATYTATVSLLEPTATIQLLPAPEGTVS